MSEAIFGLIGVVVGGVLSGAVQWAMTRRDERGATRRAARLVRSELREMRDLLTTWLGFAAWHWSWWESPREWVEHRDVLAAGVSAEVWELTERAYARVRHLDLSIEALRKKTDHPVEGYAVDEARDQLAKDVATLTAAIDALARPAGLRGRVEELPLSPYADES